MTDDLMMRARNAIEALRHPNIAFERTPGTVRYAVADVIEELLAALTADPDYCYNADDWETTCSWKEGSWMVTDSMAVGDWMEVGCLRQMPSRFAVCVERNGEYEIDWFDDEATAKATAEAARMKVDSR